MRLAISNIAWKPHERETVYALLREHGVSGLEIAPGEAFADEACAMCPSPRAVHAFERELAHYGLAPVSMQSLLYGVTGARLFGNEDEALRFEDAIANAIALAGRLGIPNLVLGSPGNRAIPDGMPRSVAEIIAIEMLRRLGDLCLNAGTVLALEPNAAAYGTNFLNTVGEAVAFAEQVDHPGITVNFDAGALHMNGEFGDVEALFASACHVVSHVHISEPGLAHVPAKPSHARMLASAVTQNGYRGWLSIEMRASGNDNVSNVERAVITCQRAIAECNAEAAR